MNSRESVEREQSPQSHSDIDELHERLSEVVEQNNSLRKKVYRLEGDLEECRVQVASGGGAAGDALRWQIGDVFVEGLTRPGWRTLRMPDRLIRLVWRAYRRRRAG